MKKLLVVGSFLFYGTLHGMEEVAHNVIGVAREIAGNLGGLHDEIGRDAYKDLLVATIRKYLLGGRQLEIQEVPAVLGWMRRQGHIDENLELQVNGDLAREVEQDALVNNLGEQIFLGYEGAPLLTDLENPFAEELLIGLLKGAIDGNAGLMLRLSPARLDELLMNVGIGDDERRQQIFNRVMQRDAPHNLQDRLLRQRDMIRQLLEEVNQVTDALQRAEAAAVQARHAYAAPQQVRPVVIQIFEAGDQHNAAVINNFNIPHLTQEQLAELMRIFQQRAVNNQIREENARAAVQNERLRVVITGLVGERGLLGNFVLLAEQFVEGMRQFNEFLRMARGAGIRPAPGNDGLNPHRNGPAQDNHGGQNPHPQNNNPNQQRILELEQELKVLKHNELREQGAVNAFRRNGSRRKGGAPHINRLQGHEDALRRIQKIIREKQAELKGLQ